MVTLTLLLAAIAAVAAVWCALLARRIHADLLEARLDIHETYFLLRDTVAEDDAWDELLEGEQEPTPPRCYGYHSTHRRRASDSR